MKMIPGKPYQVLTKNGDACTAEYFASEPEARLAAKKGDSIIYRYTKKKPWGYFDSVPSLYHWTYIGVRGGKCHLMAHHTEDSARFHQGTVTPTSGGR